MAKTTPVVILDTSVVAKWFINEPDSETATALLQEIAHGKWQPTAPEIMDCELTHVFWKNRQAGYSRRQLELALRELNALKLQSVPLSSLFPHALDITYRSDIAIYDACYVALALALKGTLATFDLDLRKRVKKHFSIPLYAFAS